MSILACHSDYCTPFFVFCKMPFVNNLNQYTTHIRLYNNGYLSYSSSYRIILKSSTTAIVLKNKKNHLKSGDFDGFRPIWTLQSQQVLQMPLDHGLRFQKASFC